MDDLQQRLGSLESSMSEVRADVSAIKATLPHLATKADLQREVGALRTELHTEVGALRTELHTEVGALRAEIGGLRAEVKEEIGGLRAELNARDTRMIQWFVGTAITLVAVVFSIVRFFP